METKLSPATGECSDTANPEMKRRLAAHPFLAGMNVHHLAILADCAIATHFAPGQDIFRAGEPANGFYLIENGKVILEERQSEGRAMKIDEVTAGEPLGWSWLFEPYLWQFDARALEPFRVLCLPSIMLRQHRDEDLFLSHELFKRMSEVMIRRLQAARTRLGAAQKTERPEVAPAGP